MDRGVLYHTTLKRINVLALVGAVCFLGGLGTAQAVITFDKGQSTVFGTGQVQNQMFDVAVNSNRMLVVHVGSLNLQAPDPPGSATAVFIEKIEYDGIELELQAMIAEPQLNDMGRRSATYTLVDPPTGNKHLNVFWSGDGNFTEALVTATSVYSDSLKPLAVSETAAAAENYFFGPAKDVTLAFTDPGLVTEDYYAALSVTRGKNWSFGITSPLVGPDYSSGVTTVAAVADIEVISEGQIFTGGANPVSFAYAISDTGGPVGQEDWGQWRAATGVAITEGLLGIDFEWGNDASGDWQNISNWTPSVTPPGGNTIVVRFGSSIMSSQTVFTNTDVTVKGIEFENANKYVIGGTAKVILDSGTGTGTIDVLEGAQEFQAEVQLATGTDVTVSTSGAGHELVFDNVVDLNSETMVIVAGSNVLFNNSAVTGGSGNVFNSGTLGGGGTINGALTNNGAGTLVAEILGDGQANVLGLDVTGTATLDGLLDVIGGFTPTSGAFTVLSALSVVDNGLALTPAADAIYNLSFTSNSVVLTFDAGIPGDFNDDGIVGGADFLLWQRDPGVGALADWELNYGTTSPLVASATGVPEPATVLMLVVGLAAGVVTRVRNRIV